METLRLVLCLGFLTPLFIQGYFALEDTNRVSRFNSFSPTPSSKTPELMIRNPNTRADAESVIQEYVNGIFTPQKNNIQTSKNTSKIRDSGFGNLFRKSKPKGAHKRISFSFTSPSERHVKGRKSNRRHGWGWGFPSIMNHFFSGGFPKGNSGWGWGGTKSPIEEKGKLLGSILVGQMKLLTQMFQLKKITTDKLLTVLGFLKTLTFGHKGATGWGWSGSGSSSSIHGGRGWGDDKGNLWRSISNHIGTGISTAGRITSSFFQSFDKSPNNPLSASLNADWQKGSGNALDQGWKQVTEPPQSHGWQQGLGFKGDSLDQGWNQGDSGWKQVNSFDSGWKQVDHGYVHKKPFKKGWSQGVNTFHKELLKQDNGYNHRRPLPKGVNYLPPTQHVRPHVDPPSHGNGVWSSRGHPGYGQGNGHGYNYGNGNEFETGYGPGPPYLPQVIGNGNEIGSGFGNAGNGISQGFGNGISQGFGNGIDPGNGNGIGPGTGIGIGPEIGNGIGPGNGNGNTGDNHGGNEGGINFGIIEPGGELSTSFRIPEFKPIEIGNEVPPAQ